MNGAFGYSCTDGSIATPRLPNYLKRGAYSGFAMHVGCGVDGAHVAFQPFSAWQGAHPLEIADSRLLVSARTCGTGFSSWRS